MVSSYIDSRVDLTQTPFHTLCAMNEQGM